MTKIRKTIVLVLLNLSIVAFVFIICEGLSSVALIAYETTTRKPVAERLHTQYDEELGWVNLPNIYLENMYGPGVYLKTNSMLFRNNRDFSQSIPVDKIRIICSGDSFTFGYGVDNDHTWCQLLTSINTSLETINMGQGGYGIDQAYLWYKRNSAQFDHNIHVFAFITQDFERMKYNKFLEYGKPTLAVRNGKLVTENVPVSKRPFYIPWLTRNRQLINNLKSIQLLQMLFSQPKSTAVAASNNYPNDEQVREIVSKIFEALQQTHQTQGSIMVLVYLPTMSDYTTTTSDPWRQFLYDQAEQRGYIVVDLIEEFRKLPPEDIEKLFIADGVIDYVDATGHYTEEGNSYIANILYEKFLTTPPISAKLNQ